MQRFSRRAFLRYSIRTLVLAITVSGLWLGAWGNRARQQAAAVRTIVASGGRVHYEWDIKCNQAGKIRRIPESTIRHWAGKTFGEDLFRRVSYIELNGNELDDTDLIPATRLTKHLEGVICEGTSVTDGGLRFIRDNRRIECVSLRQSRNVTDSTLTMISNCGQLRCLYLSGTGVTDAGLKSLRNLNRLRELELNGTRVSDEGLKELRHLQGLRFLSLRGTNVTDVGLDSLQHLNLSSLDLTGSEVSPRGVQDLQASLPKCTISR